MPTGILWVAAASADSTLCAVTAHGTLFISGPRMATDLTLSAPAPRIFAHRNFPQPRGVVSMQRAQPGKACRDRGQWDPLTSSSTVCWKVPRLSGLRCTGHEEAEYTGQGPGSQKQEIYRAPEHRVRRQDGWQARRDPGAAQLYCLCSSLEKPYPKWVCRGRLQGTPSGLAS